VQVDLVLSFVSATVRGIQGDLINERVEISFECC